MRLLYIALAAIPVAFFVACGSGSPGTATPLGPPPFANLDQLVWNSSLSVIGTVESVSPSVTDTLTGRTVDYYDAAVHLESTVFGPTLDPITVRVPFHYVLQPPNGGPPVRIPTKAPQLTIGEHVLLFLNQDEYVEPGSHDFVTAGGGVIWGKFAVQGNQVTGLSPIAPAQPLDAVLAWVQSAHALPAPTSRPTSPPPTEGPPPSPPPSR